MWERAAVREGSASCGVGNSLEEDVTGGGGGGSVVLVQVGKGGRHESIWHPHLGFASSCRRLLRDSISGLATPAQMG